MKPDLYFLPHDGAYILYAPLIRFLALVNKDTRDAVMRKMADLPLHAAERGIIETLEQRGLFREDFKHPCIDEEFAPTRATLFPTDGCNLRCRYCYASAEEGAHTLPMPVARAAVDFIAGNAKKKGYDQFSVGFHGNGEPFTAFGVVQECCEYIHATAERSGLKYAISTATNGVISDERLDWLLAYITDFNISSDILPDIQNHQRPMAGGQGSFDAVDHTTRRLDRAGIRYGIRATITGDSVERMREMALFVKEHYPKCNILHLEPVFQVGRALETHQSSSEPERFVREYIKAKEALEGSGIRLVYSGERAETLCQCFCGVCSNGFTVTAEGNATSCYEICTYKDPRASRYIYGRFDEETGRFHFDKAILRSLGELQVKNIPFCKDCFCKWHCGGDCVAKTLGGNSLEEHAGSDRCVINRALIYRQLLQKMGIDVLGQNPVLV